MSDPAIVAALRCLVPSLPASNKPFPPALLSQAESYLALSRQRASNLKPDEEIARAHVCAEIACNNLRAQLRLPAIKNGAGAPCKPKVYAKLVTFLEGILGNAAGSMTPRGRKRDSKGNMRESLVSVNVGSPPASKHLKMDVDDIPTKSRNSAKKPVHEFIGTIKNNRKATGNRDGFGTDEKAPSIVMPSIRKLCKMFSTPTLAPHVYTGTCVVLALAEIWSPDTDLDDGLEVEILTLATALYLMVLTRMQEGQMTTDIYTTVSSRSVEELGLGPSAMNRVEDWIDQVNDRKWCEEEDWWESVPESVFVFEPDASLVDENVAEVDEDDRVISEHKEQTGRITSRRTDLIEDDQDGVLLPGLGTMLHAGIDWNSEDRCLIYKKWHTSLMKNTGTMSIASGKRLKATAVG